jgi:hypothetical protein
LEKKINCNHVAGGPDFGRLSGWSKFDDFGIGPEFIRPDLIRHPEPTDRTGLNYPHRSLENFESTLAEININH